MQNTNIRHSKFTAIIVVLNAIGILFYYSSISLIGYWSDGLFLFSVILLTFYLKNKIENKFIQMLLRLSCYTNLSVMFWHTISFGHFITPVHELPKGHFGDKEMYGVFIERGNSGLLNGCYGEIQYFKQIRFIPFLEIKVESEKCSQLDYKSVLKGS